jgi:membrane-associated phospholipid phosphatase
MLRKILFAILLFGCIPEISAQNSDINLLRNINGPINSNPDALMRGVSNSVVPLMIAVPTGLLIYQRCKYGSWTHKYEPYVIGATLITSTAITLGLKYSVNRPRPFVTYTDIFQKDAHIGPYSFPSGHTSSAFALATSVSLCYPKWYVIAPAVLWACTVGYSRMYLGVHYPTDVAIGAIIGSASALLSHWIIRRYHEKYFQSHAAPGSEDWEMGHLIR